MAYGTMLADTFQSSAANTAPVIKDGNSTEIGQFAKVLLNSDNVGGTTRSSFNVSSVTRGTGTMTLAFTNAVVDANHYTLMTTGRSSGFNSGCGINPSATYAGSCSSTSVSLTSYLVSTGVATDFFFNSVAVFR